MNNKYIDQAKEIFKAAPDAMLVHFTADGRPFTVKNHADNHSLTLEDKTVFTYGREDVVMTEKILNDNPDVKGLGVKAGDTIKVGENVPAKTTVIDQVDPVLGKIAKEQNESAIKEAAQAVIGNIGGPAATEVNNAVNENKQITEQKANEISADATAGKVTAKDAEKAADETAKKEAKAGHKVDSAADKKTDASEKKAETAVKKEEASSK